jgi:hypothetical protein
MVTRPVLSFYDGYTRGLDSATALRLAKTLTSVCWNFQGGMTLIASQYQASQEIFEVFDKVGRSTDEGVHFLMLVARSPYMTFVLCSRSLLGAGVAEGGRSKSSEPDGVLRVHLEGCPRRVFLLSLRGRFETGRVHVA